MRTEHRVALTGGVLLFLMLFFVIVQAIKPMTCTQIDAKLTAYEWYMNRNGMEYDQWLEYVSLAFEWSNRGCERKTIEGDEESPATGRNTRAGRDGEWSVFPRRERLLSSTPSTGKKHLPKLEKEVG